MYTFTKWMVPVFQQGTDMKITYIYHSGFAIEMDTCVLLFDYYKGNLPSWESGKKIYIFASHKHQDHFQLKILDLAKKYPKIHFFLSNDIKLNGKYLERNRIDPSVLGQITNVGKNQRISSEDLEIQTLRSTDAGVAFIVRAEGRSFYHAGDLNWWHWEGEPYPWNENMEKDYKKEIDAIHGMHFDAAFVPLDPRLGRAYGWGMDYFLEHTDADMVFPMHMWEKYEYIGKYKKTPIGIRYKNRIADIGRTEWEWKGWNISYFPE